MRIIDISQPLCPEMNVYPGDPHFISRSVSSFKSGHMCEVSEIHMGTHCGTHIDAPLHMIPHGASLDTMPLDLFYGPCRVLTLPVQVITGKMLSEHNIQEGDRIVLRTDPQGKYSKDEWFNPSVLSMDAAQYLAKMRIKLIGIDSPTVENMETSDGEIHRILLKNGIAILEGLRLQEAVHEHYTLSAFPVPFIQENGAPCRAVLIDE